MSDKERLEEIRNRMIVEKHYFKYLNSERGYWENVYTLLEQDMNYLFNTIIEQAERVHKLALDWSELVDERNRYKQALELIYKDTFYESEHDLVSPIHVIRKRAEKALEGEA